MTREAAPLAAVVEALAASTSRRLLAVVLDSARATLLPGTVEEAFVRPAVPSFVPLSPWTPVLADLMRLAFVRSPRAGLLRVPRVLLAPAWPAATLEDVPVASSLSFAFDAAILDVDDAGAEPDTAVVDPVVLVRRGGLLAFCRMERGAESASAPRPQFGRDAELTLDIVDAGYCF